jgi:hypothetical protein
MLLQVVLHVQVAAHAQSVAQTTVRIIVSFADLMCAAVKPCVVNKCLP